MRFSTRAVWDVFCFVVWLLASAFPFVIIYMLCMSAAKGGR